MTRPASIIQTLAAAATTLIVYVLLLVFVSPLAEWLIEFFGRIFVPTRYGGGSEAGNPGVLTLLLRASLLSGLAAYAALSASFALFRSAHARTVSIALGLGVLGWAGFLTISAFRAGASSESAMLLVAVLATAGPPAWFSYTLWQEQSWS